MKRKSLKGSAPCRLRAFVVGLLVTQAAWAAPQYKVLHAFGAGNDGGGLWTSVSLDSKGNVYGATSGGGAHRQGIVFRLTPQLNGNWSETILHSFPSWRDDGQGPNGRLLTDGHGHWYGTTQGGLSHRRYGLRADA